MKYDPDSYFEYPFLRPYSSDYPNGKFAATNLKLNTEEGVLRMKLDFEIDEPTIIGKIEDGDAICCVHIYSSSTCRSELLTANEGDFSLDGTMPITDLNGRVELRPLVLAVNDIALSTKTAHPEYGGELIPVARYSPLAACEPYHFAAGATGSIESAFEIRSDDDSQLEDGEFHYAADTQERYIVIKMNTATLGEFQKIRSGKAVTTMTVYLQALTEALGVLRSSDSDSEDEYSGGWASTVRQQLGNLRIDISADSCSYGLAAQKLLGSPLAHLPRIVDAMRSGDNE